MKGVVKEVREKEIELQVGDRREVAYATSCWRWARLRLGRPYLPALQLPPASACSAIVTLANLQDGRVIPFGLCVWSTGVGPTDFVLRCALSWHRLSWCQLDRVG